MKYIEENIPSHLRLRVVHLHHGNSSRSHLKRVAGTKAKYVTIARLLEHNDHVVSTGLSACSSKDCPSRHIGRSIAVGRALADYQRGVA